MSEQSNPQSARMTVTVVVIAAVIGLALICGLFVYYGMPLIVRWLTS